MSDSNGIPLPYRKQLYFSKTMHLTKDDYRTLRKTLSGEAKSLLVYILTVHDPRKHLPSPLGYSKEYDCPSSSAYAAYDQLRQHSILIEGYDNGDVYNYVNPQVVWIGSEQSRQIQIAKLNQLAANLAAKAQEAALNARQRK
jgi:hypothetical protein